MSAVAIVVPFRAATGKRRLRPLPADTRSALALAMLEDVLTACRAIGETTVVTAGGGQGAAVAAALAGLGPGRVLVVNADLPCVVPDDLRRLELAMPPGGIGLVAAQDGTTNALALASPDLFAPLYGPGSAGRFRTHADKLGVGSAAAPIPNLADDVDELGDLERLAARLGPRTSAVVARLDAGAVA